MKINNARVAPRKAVTIFPVQGERRTIICDQIEETPEYFRLLRNGSEYTCFYKHSFIRPPIIEDHPPSHVIMLLQELMTQSLARFPDHIDLLDWGIGDDHPAYARFSLNLDTRESGFSIMVRFWCVNHSKEQLSVYIEAGKYYEHFNFAEPLEPYVKKIMDKVEQMLRPDYRQRTIYFGTSPSICYLERKIDDEWHIIGTSKMYCNRFVWKLFRKQTERIRFNDVLPAIKPIYK